MDILRKIVMIIITIIMTTFSIMLITSKTLDRSEEYLYSSTYSDVYYDNLTDNTGITQRESINNVIYNLEKDDYILDSLTDDGYYVDAVFSKGSSIWRYVFDYSNNYLMFFNNEYETSFTGETYIIEERK